MRLVIRASSLSHEVLSQSIVGEFDERGGTIGRSDSNTMTLPDPERHVSRLQAELKFSGGVFSVRNVGSSNAIMVNGKPIAPGELSALRDDDRMIIGGYGLHVSIEASAGASKTAAARVVDAGTVIGASAVEQRTLPPRYTASSASRGTSASDPFGDLLGPASAAPGADPFADLLSPAMAPPPAPARAAPQPAATPTPRPVASVAPRSAASPAPPQAAQLPDDFDPFAELEPATGDTPGAADDATLEDLVGMPPAVSGNIDNLFGLTGQETGKGDPLDAFLSPRDEAGAVKRRESLPFLTSAGDDPGEIGPGLEDHTPELQGAYKPPPVRSKLPTDAARPVRAQPQPAPQRIEPPISATSDASTDTLWEAFCEGAHLHSSTRQNLTPDLMRLLGATLRNAVDGAVALNAVRTTAKQELLVPVTVIRTRNNNPLKFAPDPTAALAAVVQPPMRGFMAGPEAMQDLMADLLGHAVGTMAGIRAAIEGMLARFEPAQLEKQLSSGGLLHTLVPMNRRARLWELYLEHYERIGEAAREDFQGLFGKAFVKAYEEQANRVAAARRNPD